MRLSTKGRFAVTAMIEVALYERQGPVPLSDIAARQQISLSYLEQMFSKLRQHGLVESTRGPGGGYSLGQNPTSITVADIIRAVDGKRAGDGRAGALEDEPLGQDMTQELWDALNSRIVDYMQSITLQKLVNERASAHGCVHGHAHGHVLVMSMAMTAHKHNVLVMSMATFAQ